MVASSISPFSNKQLMLHQLGEQVTVRSYSLWPLVADQSYSVNITMTSRLLTLQDSQLCSLNNTAVSQSSKSCRLKAALKSNYLIDKPQAQSYKLREDRLFHHQHHPSKNTSRDKDKEQRKKGTKPGWQLVFLFLSLHRDSSYTRNRHINFLMNVLE